MDRGCARGRRPGAGRCRLTWRGSPPDPPLLCPHARSATLTPMTDTERAAEVLSAADVAELLGMHVQMVRKYAASGRLPAY